jgi:hypothetical protein
MFSMLEVLTSAIQILIFLRIAYSTTLILSMQPMMMVTLQPGLIFTHGPIHKQYAQLVFAQLH